MEILDLTDKLVDLMIKSKAPDQIYFMSQVFQEHSHCYNKRKKLQNQNYKNVFIFAATPSRALRKGGVVATPSSQLFSRQNILSFFFMGV